MSVDYTQTIFTYMLDNGNATCYMSTNISE